MKFLHATISAVLGLGLNSGVLLGDFLNLDFNSPDLSRVRPGAPPSGPTEDLLRGWSIQYEDGTTPENTMFSGRDSWGPVGLKTATPIPGTGVDFGLYRVFVVGSETSSIRFSQTGMIPPEAGSLQYFRWGGTSSGVPFEVMINGETVDYSENIFTSLGTIDVSRYAGTEATFDFVFPRRSFTEFDISGFLSVPEPSTWALLGLGGAALGWQCRPRRHS